MVPGSQARYEVVAGRNADLVARMRAAPAPAQPRVSDGNTRGGDENFLREQGLVEIGIGYFPAADANAARQQAVQRGIKVGADVVQVYAPAVDSQASNPPELVATYFVRLQLPFGAFLYGDLSPIAAGTRFGVAFITMELGFAAVAALLYLAWLTGRHAFLWGVFAAGLCFASGLSLSGHAAADAGHSWLSELADWVHLSAATLWVGGLVQLVAVIWPAAPELRRAAFLGFSRIATVLVALLLVAGTYLSVLRFPHVRDLWTTGYGHVLLVKLALVALALVWGAVHHFFVVPRIERDGVAGRLSRSLLGESAVAMAVLLAAAVLVDSKPPAQQPASGPPVAARPAHR